MRTRFRELPPDEEVPGGGGESFEPANSFQHAHPLLPEEGRQSVLFVLGLNQGPLYADNAFCLSTAHDHFRNPSGE